AIVRASKNDALGTTVGGVSFGRNAQQTITRGSLTGLYTFGFNSINADSELDFEPTTTSVDMFIHLSSVPDLTDNIQVDGPDGGPFTVLFSGGLGGAVLALMSV